MRDYGKVHTSFWTSETIRSMSEDARSLAMYLLTCPHNTIAGVFRLPDGYVCDDMQWTSERVAKAFEETVAKGFANRCGTTKWVWIYKHLEWNPPENPNQRKCAEKIAASIPYTCCWKPVFMRDCAGLIGIKQEPLPNPSQTLPEPEAVTGTEVVGAKAKAAATATRLPADWKPDEVGVAFCKAERPDLDPKTTADGFRDYWVGVAGAKGRKLDWPATWRNWVRAQNTPKRSYVEQLDRFAGVI